MSPVHQRYSTPEAQSDLLDRLDAELRKILYAHQLDLVYCTGLYLSRKSTKPQYRKNCELHISRAKRAINQAGKDCKLAVLSGAEPWSTPGL